MRKHLLNKAQQLIQFYTKAHLQIVTAESCTGGLLAGAITEVSGASDIFDRGFVTYSNQAKIDLLNVPTELNELVTLA